jgi:hypothetical protein
VAADWILKTQLLQHSRAHPVVGDHDPVSNILEGDTSGMAGGGHVTVCRGLVLKGTVNSLDSLPSCVLPWYGAQSSHINDVIVV